MAIYRDLYSTLLISISVISMALLFTAISHGAMNNN